MTLTAFTGSITAATLKSNFDDKTSTMATNAAAGEGVWQVDVDRINLAVADDESVRSVEFTPADDVEVIGLGINVIDAANSLVGTLTLESPDDDDYLLEKTLEVSATTVAATLVKSRLALDSTSVTRVRLLRGVRYRIILSATGGTIDRAYGYVLLRGIRRRM